MSPWSRALQGLPAAVLGEPGPAPSGVDVLRVSASNVDSWSVVAAHLPERPGFRELCEPVERRWVAPVRPFPVGLEALPASMCIWVSDGEAALPLVRRWIETCSKGKRCPLVVQGPRDSPWVEAWVSQYGESVWSVGETRPGGPAIHDADVGLCLAALGGVRSVAGLAERMGISELCAVARMEAAIQRGLPVRGEPTSWWIEPDVLAQVERDLSPFSLSWLGRGVASTPLTLDEGMRLGWHAWCLEAGASGDLAGLASWQLGDMPAALQHLKDPRAQVGLAFDLGHRSDTVNDALRRLPGDSEEVARLCFALRESESGAVDHLIALVDRLDGERRQDLLELAAHLPTFGIDVALPRVLRWIDEAMEHQPDPARRGRLHRAAGRVAMLTGDRVEAANQYGAALPHLHASRQNRALAMCVKNLASVLDGQNGWSDLLGWLDAAVTLAQHDEEARVWCRAAVEQLNQVIPATDSTSVTHLRRLDMGLS